MIFGELEQHRVLLRKFLQFKKKDFFRDIKISAVDPWLAIT